MVSSEIGLLSDLTLLDLGMALSTAVLIAVTIKSAYLSQSLVDRSPEKYAEPSASLSVNSNTSRSVCSNLYLVWLVNVFLCGHTLGPTYLAFKGYFLLCLFDPTPGFFVSV